MDRIIQIGRHPSGGIDIGTTKDVPALVAHVSCLEQNAVRQLPLHAQAVFHASRHFQMGVDGSHAGSGWSPYADCADTGVGAVSVRAPTATGVTSIDPHLKVARSMEYSLSVQRELPHGILFQAAYVGNEGRNILRGPNINAPTWVAANLDYS